MSLQMLKVAAEAAQGKKANRVIALDLKGKSDICDYQLICSGSSDRQNRAIAEAIADECRLQLQQKPAAIEGKTGGHWILLDYGSVMIHIFLEELRNFYALESLWPGSELELAE